MPTSRPRSRYDALSGAQSTVDALLSTMSEHHAPRAGRQGSRGRIAATVGGQGRAGEQRGDEGGRDSENSWPHLVEPTSTTRPREWDVGRPAAAGVRSGEPASHRRTRPAPEAQPSSSGSELPVPRKMRITGSVAYFSACACRASGRMSVPRPEEQQHRCGDLARAEVLA